MPRKTTPNDPGIDEIVNIDEILLNALKEDIGSGDVTTSSLIPEDHISQASIVAKGNFILAGIPFARRVFQLIDKDVKFRILRHDGGRIKYGQKLAKIRGRTGRLLTAERTALNILQRLSGIATLTDRYVSRIKGTGARIVDTRKTAPGLRYFDKYAVKKGGGYNHRYGLYDGILIKDNHIAAVGNITGAVKNARINTHHLLKIEIEVSNISDVKKALQAGADIIMLDNMSVDMMRHAVDIIRKMKSTAMIEASGNISLENINEIAGTGVDLISVGALTHSSSAADISFDLD